MWNSDLHNAIITGVGLLKQQSSKINRLKFITLFSDYMQLCGQRKWLLEKWIFRNIYIIKVIYLLLCLLSRHFVVCIIRVNAKISKLFGIHNTFSTFHIFKKKKKATSLKYMLLRTSLFQVVNWA